MRNVLRNEGRDLGEANHAYCNNALPKAGGSEYGFDCSKLVQECMNVVTAVAR